MCVCACMHVLYGVVCIYHANKWCTFLHNFWRPGMVRQRRRTNGQDIYALWFITHIAEWATWQGEQRRVRTYSLLKINILISISRGIYYSSYAVILGSVYSFTAQYYLNIQYIEILFYHPHKTCVCVCVRVCTKHNHKTTHTRTHRHKHIPK